MAMMRPFIQDLINMMKSCQFPGLGISFWTLYTGIFFFTCMALMLKQLIGIGGGLPSGSNLASGASNAFRLYNKL